MRVLLAEDDMRLGKLIQYMLEQNDIDVEWVTDGNDIYSYATYAEYDILILDWMMPGETGVEMEALHAVSTALLTIYDMCKAIDKRMEITDIRLERKSGGKSGTFVR